MFFKLNPLEINNKINYYILYYKNIKVIKWTLFLL